ncbi:MAG: urea ABC transporter substrate-binding protein [Solirubrobacterales bacterium]|nr:urea ABC transporter substrate-binding protein [Solirubrobacterales bacterium]
MNSSLIKKLVLLALVVVGLFAIAGCGSNEDASSSSTASVENPGVDGDTIKVGILHSLSGTMAISEVAVANAEKLAIEEINADGGVLGKKLVAVEEDGASDWPTFAEKARKLNKEDGVAAVFGGWTSASRKAMLPVFEKDKALLYYPVQYEGLESSPYIFYQGATTNQQIIPALEYMKKEGKKKIYLVGSDYVFPRTANKEIRAWAKANDMEIVGEEYTPLGHTEYETSINKIKAAKPDAVFNTLNGDSNVAFFKQYKAAGMSCKDTQVMSVSVAEEEVGGIGIENVEGCEVAWNYYQTLPGDANKKFVKAYKAKYGKNKNTADPIEAGYLGVYLWAMQVEKAGTTNVEKVKAAADGIKMDAPEGEVTMDAENQHLWKTARIGVINKDGLIDEVWNSGKPIKPDPYLKGYSWWKG